MMLELWRMRWGSPSCSALLGQLIDIVWDIGFSDEADLLFASVSE